MLECRTVTNEKKEGILQDISFSVEKGYKVGVVGKNGAGKTTLFHTLLGDRGYTGEILYDGKNIRENMTEWTEQVAYIGEDMHFVEHATLIRNAEIFSKLFQLLFHYKYFSHCNALYNYQTLKYLHTQYN